jgi:hypothetical protein
VDLNQEKLFDISVDPDATRDERDAAAAARRYLRDHMPIPREIVELIHAYHGRQLAQDRWGK